MSSRSRILVATLVVFLGAEAILGWLLAKDSLDHVLVVLREPVVLAMLTDFTFFAGIVFFWMVADAKKRGQNGWLWLPGIIVLPTAALLVFLLRRPSSSEEVTR